MINRAHLWRPPSIKRLVCLEASLAIMAIFFCISLSVLLAKNRPIINDSERELGEMIQRARNGQETGTLSTASLKYLNDKIKG